MSDYKRKIGARIKTARTLKGLTQEQLAEQMDVSVSSISRFETGSAIGSVETLIRIAEVLDVGIEYLLYDYVSDRVITDPLTSEIIMLVEPLPEVYKHHILDVINSLCRNLPPREASRSQDRMT